MKNFLINQLLKFGVPRPALSPFQELPGLDIDPVGIALYGSYARGDNTPESDVDLLFLSTEKRESISIGVTNISVYTIDTLNEARGTIFGGHLARDARILYDPESLLSEIFSSIGAIDADRALTRILDLTQILTTPEQDLPRYLNGLARQGRYLLRSALYAIAIKSGHPCYSVRELAVRYCKPELAELLTSRPTKEPSVGDFEELVVELEHILGKLTKSVHGSLEATIINEWYEGSDLLQLALLAASHESTSSDYSAVRKILL